MDEVSIVDAWRLWLSGHLSPDATMLGVSIFWWGRLGKIMQAIGAVTIIADIIGPEKIRRFGISLHTVITSTTLIRFLRDCFEWYTIIFRHTLMKDYTDEAALKQNLRYTQLDILNYLICFLSTTVIVVVAKLYSPNWSFLIEAAIIFGCLLVSVSPLLTVSTILLLILFGLIINSAFVKPLAWVLENPSLDRLTKIASLLLLLVGFYFDLLAS